MLVAAACGSPEPSQGIRYGSPAPAIVGTTLDGGSFDLALLRGRPVVVNFWGPSCIPCRDEFPLFQEELTTAGGGPDAFALVGVLNLDDPESARAFITELGATWPTVIDPDRSVAKAYRVAARPQTYFIDRGGILRSIQVGGLTKEDFRAQLAKISGS